MRARLGFSAFVQDDGSRVIRRPQVQRQRPGVAAGVTTFLDRYGGGQERDESTQTWSYRHDEWEQEEV
jgi:predicted dithiol-disulfide oxidoreductase (DUF899 family)